MTTGKSKIRNQVRQRRTFFVPNWSDFSYIHLMKNEDRIVELLSESLKTQDRQADLLAKQSELLIQHGQLLIEQSKKIDAQGGKLDTLVEVTKDMSGAIHHLTNSVESMLKKFDTIDDHEKRLRKVERKLGL
ncbi:MAG: hypothetical protein Tsb0034_21280 [Ekhidna sp.]